MGALPCCTLHQVVGKIFASRAENQRLPCLAGVACHRPERRFAGHFAHAGEHGGDRRASLPHGHGCAGADALHAQGRRQRSRPRQHADGGMRILRPARPQSGADRRRVAASSAGATDAAATGAAGDPRQARASHADRGSAWSTSGFPARLICARSRRSGLSATALARPSKECPCLRVPLARTPVRPRRHHGEPARAPPSPPATCPG